MYLNEVFRNAPHMLIEQLSCDSRVKMNNCIFFCIKGVKYNGHEFIGEAISNGADVIVYQDEIETNGKNGIFVKVTSVEDTLTRISNIFYKYPASKLETYLISGTNGRSSVSTIINSILKNYKKCASIGVFGINYGDKNLLTNQPTLTILDNQKTLNDFVNEGCEVCTLEASAISLSYKKLDMIKPKVFIYTYTSTYSSEFIESGMNYVDSLKRYLYTLDDNSVIVLNKDDEITFDELYKASSINRTTYGQKEGSDYQISDIKLFNDHTTFAISHNKNIYVINSKLLGLVNVYNLASSFAALSEIGYDKDIIIEEISNLECVDGVMDRLNFDDFNIIVDAAFSYETYTAALDFGKTVTDDNAKLVSIISINTTDTDSRLQQLIKTADKYSDIIVLTEDDTYEDDINEVLIKARSYVETSKCLMIEDREEAIEEAIELLNKNDTLLILGKGNEKFLFRGLTKMNYIGDKNIAYKYMNKRLREEDEIVDDSDVYF